MKNLFLKLFNRLVVLSNPELRGIRRVIISATRTSPRDNPVIVECDDIFIQRISKSPIAFTSSFWANHSEWQAVKKYPEITGRLLDFGCGSGLSDILLARNGVIVHGIDMSPIGIAIANHLRSAESEAIKQRLSFSLADVMKDNPKDVYDSAWASHVFEHIKKPGPIFMGLRRWLKPNAYMLISVPLGHAHDDPSHVHHFKDEKELTSFLDGFLTIIRTEVSEETGVIRALLRLDS